MSRPVELQDPSALRDLGGLRSRDGRRIVARRLYRADALAPTDPADRETLNSLGLRLVCDLRSAAERHARPCLAWLSPLPRMLHLELAPVLNDGTATCLADLKRSPGVQTATALMQRTYELLPRACAPRLGEFFAALSEGGVPALIHCTAGKDRTGFVVAMALSAMDITRADIFADYLLAARPEHALRSTARTAHVMELILGRPLESSALTAMSSVRREFLEASFAAIERDYGGVHAYLEAEAGLDARARLRLQDILLAEQPSS